MEKENLDYGPAGIEEKLRRQQRILDVAENLFVDMGLAETSMAEVARITGISRRTLYRYYASKEDLAFAVEERIFETIFCDMRKFFRDLSGTGYEKLTRFFKALPAYIEKHKKEVKFTGGFDHYFSGEYPATEEAQRFIQMIKEGGNPLAEIIEEGKKDGSVRSDIDTWLVSRTIGNVIISMAQRIVIRGHHIEHEQEVSPSALLEQLMHLLMSFLKPERE